MRISAFVTAKQWGKCYKYALDPDNKVNLLVPLWPPEMKL